MAIYLSRNTGFHGGPRTSTCLASSAPQPVPQGSASCGDHKQWLNESKHLPRPPSSCSSQKDFPRCHERQLSFYSRQAGEPGGWILPVTQEERSARRIPFNSAHICWYTQHWARGPGGQETHYTTTKSVSRPRQSSVTDHSFFSVGQRRPQGRLCKALRERGARNGTSVEPPVSHRLGPRLAGLLDQV